MKHNDAKALVLAMFDSKQASKTGEPKMLSPKVQQAYSEAFGGYPLLVEGEKLNFWAERLREIADVLVNRCPVCDGSGEIPKAVLIQDGKKKSDLVRGCSKCKGEGWISTTVAPDKALESCIQHEVDVVTRIKSILKQFGIKDSDNYVQATIYLDYEDDLVGVSIKKKMFTYVNNKTTDRRSSKS